MRRAPILMALAGLSVVVSACSATGTRAAEAGSGGGQQLRGAFKLAAGSCNGGQASGTYFRMITPGGSIASGPFFSNPDSTCADKSYTLAVPGSDGGFITGTYQPDPAPAFSSTGSALAGRIVGPQAFTAINFGLSTNATDPQTHHAVPVPRIWVTGDRLSGQIEAWSASWNNQYFNQGSPKPDGTRPGLTAPVSGTYDAATRAFVLTWASEVVSGPFNGFTGYWHLQGTFVPRG